ncbi:MAG TPA: right-handed parallel beta-helix repeat-containing protein [Phycisphaerales bacterium]|nr:right-handed parallel beta-helix repeat-containing protein [Phycisphaerales bacterium]
MRELPFALAGLGLVALAGILRAGPLDPPAGSVSPSYKTLAQVEPRTPIPGGTFAAAYVITQPGSYYLTDNIRLGSGGSAIFVQASNVTIDLNGFSIISESAAADTAIDVFEFNVPAAGITIRNGSIRGNFSQGSLRLHYAQGVLVENVRISDNPDMAFSLGVSTTANNCTASGCKFGFWGAGATLTNCTVTGTPLDGSAFVLTRSVARHCEAIDNVGTGFELQGNSLIEFCTARDNALSGGTRSNVLLKGSGNRVDSCTISGGFSAMYITSGSTDNLVMRNTFRRGSSWGIIQASQSEGSYPGNHVAQVIANPASPFTATNPMANIEY